MAESLNDLIASTMARVQRMVEVTDKLPSGSWYGPPFDFCGEAESVHNRLCADLRDARARASVLIRKVEHYGANELRATEEKE